MVFTWAGGMKLCRAGLLAGAAMVATAGVSSADTVSGGSISFTGLTDYTNQLGYLSKFNGAAGTLTGVDITVGYGFSSTITVSATTDSKGSVSTESAAKFDSSDSGIKAVLNSTVNRTSAVIGSSALEPAAYDLNGNKSIYNVGPTYGTSSANYTSAANAQNTYSVSPSALSAFVASAGSTAFDVYGSTLTGLLLTATGGNASAVQRTTASQTISVLYTYTQAVATTVPEPASLALLGAGLMGAGLIRRRNAA